jgi:hypothetical protein
MTVMMIGNQRLYPNYQWSFQTKSEVTIVHVISYLYLFPNDTGFIKNMLSLVFVFRMSKEVSLN